MNKENKKLWKEALAIIDDNLGVQEDFIITNRFATASKIVEFAQAQVKKLTIPVVVKSFTTITSCGQTLKKCDNCGEIKDILDW